eukprot:TRINITY_DN42117_c0_g1_i1.p1 TRINITY_DN42117_c0_g1~~TRINITY_DN42117_c0_g1_i1.p1  ORF type:complete len:453 (+),score=-64.90 TRINITY_DN42117_c0_g1_i1:749-2107(+)
MWLTEVAQAIGLVYNGADFELSSVSTDSRSVKAGGLFVAIRGEQRDGHSFIEEAIARGASAVIAAQEAGVSETTVPILRVNNTTTALGQLAATHRANNITSTVFGVTGSCGKTTIKNLLASILRRKGNVRASKRSFNNAIGVPLTLLETQPDHTYLVAEIGTNFPGEIAALSQMVRPHIACISNAAETHLAGLHSVAGVAREKSALLSALGSEDKAVINAEDPYAHYWSICAAPAECLTFGIEVEASVQAKQIVYSQEGKAQFVLCIGDASISVDSPLSGRHNVMNVLAAAAMATAAGCSLIEIKLGLKAAFPEPGRFTVLRGLGGYILIDDTYNANPHSVRAAITTLSTQFGDRKKTCLVLADMLELGEHSVSLHREIGTFAKAQGITSLFCYGEATRHTAEAFGAGALHFTHKPSLQEKLSAVLTSESVVLIKGSRGMAMETIVEHLARQ